jgi:hypothetical protein
LGLYVQCIPQALKKVRAKIKKLKCDKWLFAAAGERTTTVDRDEYALEEVGLLDGCYVIKSDVLKVNAEAQTLHDRHCDLEKVERAFRTMKSAHLEMRPVYVRKEECTKGHAFVVMLALLIQRELERCWAELDITVEEGIGELGSIHMEEVHIGGAGTQTIPTPNHIEKKLLNKAGIDLPSALPSRTPNVHTKKKLPSERLQK